MAAAATGGAVGDGLNLIESLFQILKGLGLMHCVLNIEICHLFAFANRVIFHVITSKNAGEPDAPPLIFLSRSIS